MTLKVGDRLLCAPSIIKSLREGSFVIYKMANGAKCYKGELTPVLGDQIKLWGVESHYGIIQEAHPREVEAERIVAEMSEACQKPWKVVPLIVYRVAETDGAT